MDLNGLLAVGQTSVDSIITPIVVHSCRLSKTVSAAINHTGAARGANVPL
jgi:hypothetical protein